MEKETKDIVAKDVGAKKITRKKLIVKEFAKAEKPAKKTKVEKPKKPTKKCAFAALIGTPNAGKSTLINRIIGTKISIVTPKVQTTRTRIQGIKTSGLSQIVFVDTPGIFKLNKKLNNKLNKTIVQSAIDTLEEVDFIALVVDVKDCDNENLNKILTILAKSEKKKLLVINKIDLLHDKSKLFGIATDLNERVAFDATFMVSATKNDGVDGFIKYIADNAKNGEWHYPEEQYTDAPERLLAAEITREKLLLSLDKEIPYKLNVETEAWVEGKHATKINQVIFTETEAHKKIIVGKQGQNLKQVGERARVEISRMLGRKAHLFLFVKVKPDWIDKRETYEISTF
jgi:GTP-binding protein Era